MSSCDVYCVMCNLIKVVHDQSKEGHEDQTLNDNKEVVLICHTPNDSSLFFTHPVWN